MTRFTFRIAILGLVVFAGGILLGDLGLVLPMPDFAVILIGSVLTVCGAVLETITGNRQS